jgi:hypothetical protein
VAGVAGVSVLRFRIKERRIHSMLEKKRRRERRSGERESAV